MNHSGGTAEQIVRMSLEGVEVAAKITGTAAKELAVFLVAALNFEAQGQGAHDLYAEIRQGAGNIFGKRKRFEALCSGCQAVWQAAQRERYHQAAF